MGRIFRGRVAESTEDGLLIDFDTVSPKPTMSCDELDEIAQGRATESSQFRDSVHGWEPLFGLGHVGQGGILGGGPIEATIGPFLLPFHVSEL